MFMLTHFICSYFILNLLRSAQDAGAFAVVLECVPDVVGRAVTETLEIPTIGIGAGAGTSGQVLVYHDMLGLMSHPHHQQFVPKFCKQYASLGDDVREGLNRFRDEVESGAFPSQEFSPYTMGKDEEFVFRELLKKDELQREKQRVEKGRELTQADEYETLNLYGGNSNNR